MAEQLANDPAGGARGNRKSEALSHGDNRRVDTDDAPPRIDKRPTAVARIERGRVLDDVLDQPSFGAPHGTADRADDARRDGRAEAERVAHGNHELPDL